MGRPVFFAGVFSVDAGVFRLWILPLAGRLFFSCRGRVGRFGCREFFPSLLLAAAITATQTAAKNNQFGAN